MNSNPASTSTSPSLFPSNLCGCELSRTRLTPFRWIGCQIFTSGLVKLTTLALPLNSLTLSPGSLTLAQVNASGNVVRSEILGAVKMKCYLSGMPELRLGLNDKVMFENTGRSEFTFYSFGLIPVYFLPLVVASILLLRFLFASPHSFLALLLYSFRSPLHLPSLPCLPPSAAFLALPLGFLLLSLRKFKN